MRASDFVNVGTNVRFAVRNGKAFSERPKRR